MFETLGNLFERKPTHKGAPLVPEPGSAAAPLRLDGSERKQTFSKVFRWHLPDGQTQAPESVEVVGTFSHWQRIPLIRENVVNGWHATVHHIQGNRTHHYMLLINGKPTMDKNCDGLAVPHGADEERYQVMTIKGPRVMMLFAQTK